MREEGEGEKGDASTTGFFVRVGGVVVLVNIELVGWTEDGANVKGDEDNDVVLLNDLSVVGRNTISLSTSGFLQHK